MNIAGSESGQQSNFFSHGTGGGTFNVDGVNLTDMSALGASSGYYDFDMFQELQVITGGGDASIAGSGAHLNMITKRGTNDVHGSARVFGVDERFESSNIPDEALGQGTPIASGNRIETLQDYGAEAGGPIWRDHLWIWGSYGRSQINLVTAGGASDKTTLENLNGKLNWQIVPSNAMTGCTATKSSSAAMPGRRTPRRRPGTRRRLRTPGRSTTRRCSRRMSSRAFSTTESTATSPSIRKAVTGRRSSTQKRSGTILT
jgi:hypothetical protein